jgi:hypothetical protein
MAKIAGLEASPSVLRRAMAGQDGSPLPRPARISQVVYGRQSSLEIGAILRPEMVFCHILINGRRCLVQL